MSREWRRRLWCPYNRDNGRLEIGVRVSQSESSVGSKATLGLHPAGNPIKKEMRMKWPQ